MTVSKKKINAKTKTQQKKDAKVSKAKAASPTKKDTTKPSSVLTANEAVGYVEKGKSEREKREKSKEEKEPKSSGGNPLKEARVTIVVQAKDGKWNFGDKSTEKELESMPKGQYASAADASQAAATVSDVIINTGSPEKKPVEVKNWGVSNPQAVEQASGSTSKIAAPIDGVALKKVCADAGVDPKLARRILRSKGKKPGGRWEWSKAEAPKIVELLKAEAAKAAK